jgi:hypothetical protein
MAVIFSQTLQGDKQSRSKIKYTMFVPPGTSGQSGLAASAPGA